MKLPVSFEQFSKNPVTAIAFIAVGVIGYLYMDMINIHEAQLQNMEETCVKINTIQESQIQELKEANLRYEDKLEQMNQKLLECLSTRN
jgi:hypothetical protein